MTHQPPRPMSSKPLLAGLEKPVSRVALGTAWYSLDTKYQWFELMDQFVEHGGSTIDTARMYGEGEIVIGQWLQERRNRDQIVVVTKGGLSPHDGNRLAVEGIQEQIEKDLTESLERLQTDCIDLYLLHRDTESIPVAQIMDCLNAQRDRGRISAFGGSNWTLRRVEEANEYAHKHGLTGFAAVSNNLSLAAPAGPFYPGLVSVDRAEEPWFAEHNMPDFSWSSQARGFFTGRYRPETRDDPAKAKDGFLANMIRVYCTDENFERLRRAEKLGKDKGGYSAVQIALAWVLHRPLAVVPLVGPHTPEELDSCAAAAGIELTGQEARWLDLQAEPR